MAKRDSKGKGAKEPENDNFVRLCALLIDEGTKVLKDIFDRLHPEDNLQQLLEDPVVHAALTEFFPDMSTNGLRFNKNSSQFDIALLWLLVSIGKTLPDRGRLTLKTNFALMRINDYRQDLYVRNEKSETNISDDEFKRLWNGIEGMLSGFGGTKGREAEISKMKDAPINSKMKERYIQLLEKWSKCEDYLKKHQAAQKQVDGTNETEAKGHDDGKQGPSSTTKKVETHKEIERLAQVIEEMRSKVKAMRLTGGEELEVSQIRTACKNIDRDVNVLQSKLSTNYEIIDVLEGKVKDLSYENEQLKAELHKVVEKSEKTEVRLELLKEKTEVSLRTLTKENELLTKESKETKATLHLLTQKIESLEAQNKEKEINKQILNFAQFCWDIEGLMFKHVFPSLYKDYTCYREQDIKDEIAKLETEGKQEDSKKANTKFEELKETLNWVSPVYEKSMNSARFDRKSLAHPRISLPDVEQCITFLHENKKLQDWMTYEQAVKLKDILKKLRSMDEDRK